MDLSTLFGICRFMFFVCFWSNIKSTSGKYRQFTASDHREFDMTFTCGDKVVQKSISSITFQRNENEFPCECYFESETNSGKLIIMYKTYKQLWELDDTAWGQLEFNQDVHVFYANITGSYIDIKQTSRSDVLKHTEFNSKIGSYSLVIQNSDETEAYVTIYCTGSGDVDSLMQEELSSWLLFQGKTVTTIIIPVAIAVLILILIILCCCYKCYQSKKIRRTMSVVSRGGDEDFEDPRRMKFEAMNSNNNLYSSPKTYPNEPRSPSPTAPLSQHEDLSFADNSDAEDDIMAIKRGLKTEAQVHHENEVKT